MALEAVAKSGFSPKALRPSGLSQKYISSTMKYRCNSATRAVRMAAAVFIMAWVSSCACKPAHGAGRRQFIVRRHLAIGAVTPCVKATTKNISGETCMKDTLADKGSGHGAASWLMTLPTVVLLVLILILSTGEMVHGQLLKLGA